MPRRREVKRPSRTTPELPGRREQKKLETGSASASAADLFTRHGYGAATMREIAQRAHVGLGTLFNYAADKRDLVFLIFNEELNAVTDVALAAPRPGRPLVDQLIAVFRVHYRWLATKPVLARILLQELTFYSSGKQAATFLGPPQATDRRTRGARARRAARPADPLARGSRRDRAPHLFVYSASLRWWIAAPRPNPEKGVADLRRLLKLQADGLRYARDCRPDAGRREGSRDG